MRLNDSIPRINVATKKKGSFADSVILPPLYPSQQLESSNDSNMNIVDNDCDSCSSSSSGSEYENDHLARKELSAIGSFAESLRLESVSRTVYPESCLIPSLSDTPNELSMKMYPPPPPPPPSSSSSSKYHNGRRQLFRHESKANFIGEEHRMIGVAAGRHPKTSSTIQCNNTEKKNSTSNKDDGNLIQEYSNIEGTFSTNKWLQKTGDCYSISHGHMLLPVVLEEDEGAAISSSPELQQNDRKECKIETEVEINTKMTNLCSSTNGESLHSILLNHKSCDDDDHHFENNDIDKLKIDPGTETIGSDTYQTQSLSNNSSSSFNTTSSKDHEMCPSPSATTHRRHLEEELDSRLQVIMALKDVILHQNRNSKRAARTSRKTNSKLISCTRANKKLMKQNKELEEQMKSLKIELGEMKLRMVEAEMEFAKERRQMVLTSRIGDKKERSGKNLYDIGCEISVKDRLPIQRSIGYTSSHGNIEFSDDDIFYDGDTSFDEDENNEMASF